MHSHPVVHRILVEAYLGDLRRAAARDARRRTAIAPTPGSDPIDVPLTIRRAWPEDARALRRLAGLDSAAVPAAPVLLALAGDQLRAAVSLRDGTAASDPFHPSIAALELLRVRAGQLTGGRPAPRRAGPAPAAAVRPDAAAG
jgi:hypothetical protein